jgi:alpha-L-rhamnosidase
MGATTIWERWDSMLPDGSINPGDMTSFNHYALGAVADFLHRRVAGLAPGAPGYRHLTVQPLPGGGLSHARAEHRTPYGWARVAWERRDGQLHVDVTVPPSTSASIVLPDTEPLEVRSGRHSFVVPFRSVADDVTSPPRPPHPFDQPASAGATSVADGLPGGPARNARSGADSDRA